MNPSAQGVSSSWLDRPLSFVSAALPFALSVSRAASSGQWRDDLPAVRDLGLITVGIGGSLSTFCTQALSLVPLGSRTFRAALASAIGLAVASLVLNGIARRMLLRAGTPAWLSALLAMVVTLTAAMSPSFQREATVGGGAMLAVAAALCAVAQAISIAHPEGFVGFFRWPLADAHEPRSPVRSWIGLGACVGAAAAENPPAALAALCAASALIAALRLPNEKLRALFVFAAPVNSNSSRAPGKMNELEAPFGRCISLALLAAVFVLVLLSVPFLVRPLVPRAFADIGRELSAGSVSAFDVAVVRKGALSAWIAEVSLLSLGISAAGAVLSLRNIKTRALLLPFAVLIALDLLLPAKVSSALSADSLAPIRLLSLASIALCSALGVGALIRWIVEARVPMAKSASVLLVVFHMTLIALTTEEAGFATDRSEQFAAEAWTDAALLRLEPRSAILVNSPAVLWRLWAARAVRGERPDVVVIPASLINRGRIAKSLLSQDQALSPLLRSYALTQTPSEYALSQLADVRPLHVEFDRDWSKRIVTHLMADGLWLEYAPQPLGSSDRKMAARTGTDSKNRVLKSISSGNTPDISTASVVSASLLDQSLVLSLLGEHDEAGDLADRAQALLPRESLHMGIALHRAAGRIRRSLAGREPVKPRASN